MTGTSAVTAAKDLAAIQTQLQVDRAKLASEVGNRLGSLSPGKSILDSASRGAARQNPFRMSKGLNDSTSPFASSSSSSMFAPSPFSQRPVTLGLGAEPSEHERKQAAGAAENARLRGALVGKRKREMDQQHALGADEKDNEEESKSYAARATAARERPGPKADPFAGKKGKGKRREILDEIMEDKPANQSMTDVSAGLSKSARKKLRKRMKREANGQTEATSGAESPSQPVEKTTAIIKSSLNSHDTHSDMNGGMTAHQKTLVSQLSGARFRQINETLYTTDSSDALALIQGEPSKLREYHEGFREQVKGWPKVPVRQIADIILKAQSQSTIVKAEAHTQKQPRGRFAPGALVVDLGAGEAILAKLLAAERSTIRVLSYDLLDSDDGWVKGLDIAKVHGLPLPGSLSPGTVDQDARVVDVAVFCLSLMGTNWVGMIIEASRILRTGGDLLIAEVTSRFNTKAAFVEVITSLGFKLIREDTSNSHFILFELQKVATPLTILGDEHLRATWVEKGSKILKPCIYKRR